MSSGPSTFGIMITSSAAPASSTAAVRSSRPHGESRLLTRVQNWVSPNATFSATSTSPARAASLSAAGTPSSRLARSTSTVGARSGSLARIFSLWAGKKWIARLGRTGISRTGAGAPTASGLKKSLGERTPQRYVPPRTPLQTVSDTGCNALAGKRGDRGDERFRVGLVLAGAEHDPVGTRRDP